MLTLPENDCEQIYTNLRTNLRFVRDDGHTNLSAYAYVGLTSSACFDL